MSAQDNLSPAQFYHGTSRVLQPGQHIVPPRESGNQSQYAGAIDGVEGHTYATHLPVKAYSYAERDRDYRVYQAEDRVSASRALQHHVYEVTPIGPHHEDPNDQDSIRSPGHMKVQREVPIPDRPYNPGAWH